MSYIDVNKSKILIENGIINNCSSYILNEINLCKVLIITDENVSKIYLNSVIKSFKNKKINVEFFIIKSGEKYKNFETVKKIYKILSLNFMSRTDAIISLGGGIVTDITGFIASTYNRGVKLVHIPTSLLAQVDASIGGKNSINLEYGKNLVGTFYNPIMVLIDPQTIKTLPKTEINCGIAEIIKYGCIKDKKLFQILENENFEKNLTYIIKKSVLVKKTFVEKDEFDLNERMILNFGHTIGHAIEKTTNYTKLSHGEAVAIGMNLITKISESLSLTESGTFNKLNFICKKYLLPVETSLSIDNLSSALMRDKKILNNFLNFVLIKEIGKSFIYKIPHEKIIHFLKGRDVI